MKLFARCRYRNIIFIIFGVLFCVILSVAIIIIYRNHRNPRVREAEQKIDEMADVIEQGDLSRTNSFLSPTMRWGFASLLDEDEPIDDNEPILSPVPPSLISIAKALRTRTFKADKGDHLEFISYDKIDGKKVEGWIWYYVNPPDKGILIW